MQGKRITRSRNDRIIAGVAGGLAAYLNIDPIYIRIGFVLLGLGNGLGFLLYLLLWLLLPNQDNLDSDARTQVRESVEEMRDGVESLITRVRTMFNP